MSSNEKQNIKHISDIVGELGIWQLNFIGFSTILRGVSALGNMGYGFHAFSNDYWCSDVPPNLPLENRTSMMKCFQYSNPKEKCTEWQYDRSQFHTSITTEFDLVCDRANFGSTTQALYMLGYIISGLVFAHYSDKYGRRPITWLSMVIEILGMLLSALSYNVYVYAFSRFLVGMGSSGRWMSVYTIIMEICGPKYRSDVFILGGIGWVAGYAFVPAMAYWLQDFRLMQYVSAAPLFLMMVWFYFLDESPRWQITNGYTEKAEQTLRKALNMNGKSDTELKEQLTELSGYLRKMQGEEVMKKKHSIRDLFKTPNLRRVTMVMWFSWIVNSLLYYGISLNMADFGGNFYITFFLAGIVEFPSDLFTVILLKFVGRRTLFFSYMLLIALSCFAIIFSEAEWMKVMFALICKFGTAASWIVMAVRGGELFPTVLRHTGMGSSSVVGRIGSVSAPYMKNLAMSSGLTVVMILYGTLTSINAFAGLLMPETKGKEIPDTIEETENHKSIELKVVN